MIWTWEGHDLPVFSLSFSPDGRILASGSLDGTIILWDAATCSQVQTLDLTEGGQISSVAVAFSSDGRNLASWYRRYNSTVKIWDISSGFLNQTVALPNSFEDVAFSPDSGKLASRTNNVSEIFDNAVKVWDIGMVN